MQEASGRRIDAESLTYRAGRARGAVDLFWGVLLFLWEGGHGRELGGSGAGVGEDKGGLSGALSLTGRLWITAA